MFIFLYRNPVYTLYKPFNRHHLKYIGVPFDTSLKGILTSGQDLLYIDRLFTKFTKSNEKRNYKILIGLINVFIFKINKFKY